MNEDEGWVFIFGRGGEGWRCGSWSLGLGVGCWVENVWIYVYSY